MTCLVRAAAARSNCNPSINSLVSPSTVIWGPFGGKSPAFIAVNWFRNFARRSKPCPIGTSAARSVEPTTVGAACRVFVIGDTNCLSMGEVAISDSFAGCHYMVVSKYISGFAAANMMAGKELAPNLLAALESEHLVRNGRFIFASLDQKISPVVSLRDSQARHRS